jgi:hypothetical protein
VGAKVNYGGSASELLIQAPILKTSMGRRLGGAVTLFRLAKLLAFIRAH